eukprot:m.61854 g.61854  ORF g.61854 m.61854 type:complete len:114 (-) comp15778_c0_seq4:113-454(-)
MNCEHFRRITFGIHENPVAQQRKWQADNNGCSGQPKYFVVHYTRRWGNHRLQSVALNRHPALRGYCSLWKTAVHKISIKNHSFFGDSECAQQSHDTRGCSQMNLFECIHHCVW